MKKILFLSLSLISFYSYSQREVVVIDRSKAKKQVNDNMPRRMVEHRHVFKMDPIRMSIGEINFSYERKVDEKLSLEFEFGPTVSNLGVGRFSDIIFNPGGIEYKENSRMGGFGSVALRFYPLDDRLVFNQLYVSPKFKFRRYNEQFEVMPPSNLGTQNGFLNESVFTFNVGYQQWLAQNFSFDYYVGFGIAGAREMTYMPTSLYDGNTNTWVETWEKRDNSYSRFVMTIGLKIGIGN
jgi:hypothetical protein